MKIAIAILCGALVFGAVSFVHMLPSKQSLATRIDAIKIPLSALPPHLVDAVVSAEDPNYFSRSLGKSPIAAHVARWMYPRENRTIYGLLNHEIKATWLAWQLDHQQMLALMLDQAYFGKGVIGISRASHRYFGVEVADVDLPQAVFLAMLVKAPQSTATKSRSHLRKQYDQGLAAMFRSARLSRPQYETLLAQPMPY